MNDRKTYIFMYIALIVLGGSLFGLLYGIHAVLPREVMYDCRLAEISADIPQQVKEECRKKLKESLK